MILENFIISSYRSCLKTSFPLNDELTTLIGVNGSGKTNILNGLLLLKKICMAGPSMNIEEGTVYNSCSISADIKLDSKTIKLKGDVIFETDDRNVDEVKSSNIRWGLKDFDSNKSWIKFPFWFLDNNSPYRNYYMHQMKLRGVVSKRHKIRLPNALHGVDIPSEKVIRLLTDVAAFFNGIHYYSASQFSDPSKCPVFLELEENRLLRRSRQSIGHEKFIYDLYKSLQEKDKKRYKRYINIVGKNGIGLVDDISFEEVTMPSSSYEVKIGGKVKKIEKNRLVVIPRFTVDGIMLSPNQLSEGTFKTLVLLFNVLSEDGKLLLIEEPEVCVHHGLLNSIIDIIKSQSKSKQIVISTHSDFVLDSMKPESVILVKRELPGGTIAKKLTSTMTMNDYSALKTYLEDTGNLGEYWKEGGFDNE